MFFFQYLWDFSIFVGTLTFKKKKVRYNKYFLNSFLTAYPQIEIYEKKKKQEVVIFEDCLYTSVLILLKIIILICLTLQSELKYCFADLNWFDVLDR